MAIRTTRAEQPCGKRLELTTSSLNLHDVHLSGSWKRTPTGEIEGVNLLTYRQPLFDAFEAFRAAPNFFVSLHDDFVNCSHSSPFIINATADEANVCIIMYRLCSDCIRGNLDLRLDFDSRIWTGLCVIQWHCGLDILFAG